MSIQDHGLISAGNVHTIYEWVFADAAAMASATNPNTGLGYVSTDLNKKCLQVDTGVEYRLLTVTPTWGALTAGDLTISSQASGDMLYFNGTNWVRLAKGTVDQVLAINSGATAPVWKAPDRGYMITGTLASGTTITDTLIPRAMTLDSVLLGVGTAPLGSGSSITVDVKYSVSGGAKSSIFSGSAYPTIASGAYYSTGGTLSTTSLAANSHIQILVVTVGSSTAGDDLTTWLLTK